MNKTKQDRLLLGNKILLSAEIVYKLDKLEPINDVSSARDIINRIKDKNI